MPYSRFVDEGGLPAVEAFALDEMLDAYLHHLGISSERAPTLELLQRLQRAHVQTIPYENLDPLAGETVSLDPIELFRKIIIGRRGGYCFELNVLFGWLLCQLGFEPELRMGRVWLRDPQIAPPRNHAAHVVRIGGSTVIADVGFGGRAPRRPLDLSVIGQPLDDGDAVDEPLRIVAAGEYGVMIQRRIMERWSNQFTLEPIAAHMADLEVANHYQATAPDSQFRHHLFVGLFRENGRDGLFDTRLSRRQGADTTLETLTSVDQMAYTLEDVFGIDAGPHAAVLAKIMEMHGCR